VAQRAALYVEGFSWPNFARRHALVANSLLALLFVAALAKGLADPSSPSSTSGSEHGETLP